MNKFNLLLLVGATMLFSACASTSDLKTDVLMASKPLLTPAEVNSILDSSQGSVVQILDVRTPEEFLEGCLSGAKNVDIKSGLFDEKIALLDKNTEYLLYCRSGKRSANAAGRMRQAGFESISELEGGILAWQEAGYNVNGDCK